VISDQELHRKIRALLEFFEHPSADIEITNATSLGFGGLELTSLELVRLFVGLEEDLGIELEDAAMFDMNFDTVRDIVELIRSSQERNATFGQAVPGSR